MCDLRHEHAHASLKSRLNIIRALKDDEYRDSLSDASPAGAVELDDADLGLATGGLLTAGCGCSGGCSHHCGSLLLPGAAVINPSPILATPTLAR
jgi:mersacidin/lichenicidin family type 2 lantibiotic